MVNSLGSGWDSVDLGSYCLCNFLYSFLELGLGFDLYSWGQGCYSSIEGRLTNCIVGRSVPEGEGCSIEDVVVKGEKLQSFCFLRIRFRVAPLIAH